MAPKTSAVKSLAVDSVKRRRASDSKSKPADPSELSGVGKDLSEESLLAGADVDHVKKTRTLHLKVMI